MTEGLDSRNTGKTEGFNIFKIKFLQCNMDFFALYHHGYRLNSLLHGLTFIVKILTKPSGFYARNRSKVATAPRKTSLTDNQGPRTASI